MKELRAVINAAEKAWAAGILTALATVVAVQGSSYRRPGARMLIMADGTAVGGVSGGCLEADVVEHARRVMRDGQSCVITYDTTEDDILTGVGLGCQGVVQILIEPLPASASHMPLTALEGLLRERRAGVLATVCGVEGESTVHLGERLLLSASAILWDGISDAAQAPCLEADARDVLGSGVSRTERYQCAGFSIEVFLESLLPPPSLLICGAGNDAQPLTEFAKGLGWHVTVADARPAFAMPTRFPHADAVLVAIPEELAACVTIDDRTAIVVMTHNYLRDRAWLGALLPLSVCYCGVLGPRRRTESLRNDLHEDGLLPTHGDRLRGPVGLDIGADGPEQIALSIIAEIQAVFAGRSGGPLSQRQRPIYEANGTVVMEAKAMSSFERSTCPL